jgi:mRNA interferase MazF
MVRSYVPERGDVVDINFDPQEGREQAGRRPAIVLSPASYNGTVGLAIFCPLTRQKKGYIFEVDIPAGEAVTGIILSDQVKSLDWRKRNAKRRGALPDEIVEDVLAKIAALLNPHE